MKHPFTTKETKTLLEAQSVLIGDYSKIHIKKHHGHGHDVAEKVEQKKEQFYKKAVKLLVKDPEIEVLFSGTGTETYTHRYEMTQHRVTENLKQRKRYEAGETETPDAAMGRPLDQAIEQYVAQVEMIKTMARDLVKQHTISH